MSTPQPRKTLSADGVHRLVAASFAAIPDSRPQPQISVKDALLSGFALFSLKDPSLLAFDERRHEGNLRRLFGISRVPSDSRLREILALGQRKNLLRFTPQDALERSIIEVLPTLKRVIPFQGLEEWQRHAERFAAVAHDKAAAAAAVADDEDTDKES